MFGRKTIAELKRRVALAESICEELADENCALARENERLREAQILRIAASPAAARLADHQQLKAFHVAVDVAEVVEPRPYVVWDPRTEPRPAQGESELTDTEAHVVPCPKCSQPHGDGGVCGTDIKEAA